MTLAVFRLKRQHWFRDFSEHFRLFRAVACGVKRVRALWVFRSGNTSAKSHITGCFSLAQVDLSAVAITSQRISLLWCVLLRPRCHVIRPLVVYTTVMKIHIFQADLTGALALTKSQVMTQGLCDSTASTGQTQATTLSISRA